MRFLVIIIAVALATAAFSATAKDSTKYTKPVIKQEVIKTPSIDTLRVLRTDTMLIVKHKELILIKTWLDTVKLQREKLDSEIVYDTLIAVKKVPKAAATVVQEKVKKSAKTAPTK